MSKPNYDYLFQSNEPPAENWRRSAPAPVLVKALQEYRTEQLAQPLKPVQNNPGAAAGEKQETNS